jgi:phosphoglycerate dehydrogenase-like enzyme
MPNPLPFHDRRSPVTMAFSPRHIVVGATAHADIADTIRRARPNLEIVGRMTADVTAADLDWADTYIGFKRPPPPTMGNVRWVHCTGAGVDAWLHPDPLPRDILLTRTSESFGPMIAEWALARALAFSQELLKLAEAQRRHEWAPRHPALVRGTTALVLGTGDVGRHVACAFAALGCSVHGISRSGTADPTAFASATTPDRLLDAVPAARWLIVTVPLTGETHHLVSRDVLMACQGAILLNAARGAVVDESALIDALETGHVAGAALDVFETEPLPPNSPLWEHPRVVVSPHLSGRTTVAGAVAGFLECLDEIERGVVPHRTVDRQRQY